MTAHVCPVESQGPVWPEDKKIRSLMDRAIAREQSLSRLLMTYIITGLIFMLLPGTFLGVWNLIKISGREAVESISPAWIQAHGHAQLFGWVGTFILGIGFYAIPKLRKLKPFALWEAWTCYALWVVGVTTRWLTNIYAWHWRVALPLSAALEVVAFLTFFHPEFTGVFARIRSALLIVSTWGFLVPMVWGFSLRWLPVFMGLRPLRNSLLLVAAALNTMGVMAGFCEQFVVASACLLAGASTAVVAIRFFEPRANPAKTSNLHPSFPIFIRIAYGWLLVAAALSIWAARQGQAPGIWGASRHALTVGFIATMVFCVGQRVLPLILRNASVVESDANAHNAEFLDGWVHSACGV